MYIRWRKRTVERKARVNYFQAEKAIDSSNVHKIEQGRFSQTNHAVMLFVVGYYNLDHIQFVKSFVSYSS